MRLNRLWGLVAIAVIFALSGCGAAKPALSEPVFAQSVDQKTGKAINPQTTFDPGVKRIYLSTLLKDAPSDTKIRFEWYYMEQGETLIDKVNVAAEGERYVFSYLNPPKQGWPAGKYKVKVYLNQEKAQEKVFSVALAQGAVQINLTPQIYLDNFRGLAMAENIDASGSPVGKKSVLAVTNKKIYCFAFAKNLDKGDMVKGELYYLNQSNVKPVLQASWKSNISGNGYIHSSFSNEKNWPAGNYKAIIYLNGKKGGEIGFKMQ